MKWISDDDERKLREARKVIAYTQVADDAEIERLQKAYDLLAEVLDSIHALAQEQPHPEPRIVELSEDEMRKIYPERYPQ